MSTQNGKAKIALNVFCIWTKIAQDVFCDKDRPGLVLHWPVKNWKQVNLQPKNRQESAILLLASTLLRFTAAVQTFALSSCATAALRCHHCATPLRCS